MRGVLSSVRTIMSARQHIEAFLADQQQTNPLVLHVEEAAAPDLELGAHARWYLRMRSDEKTVVTVWLTMRERTLHFETYVAPAPEENVAQAFEYALRVNKRLAGMAFCIGGEDAFFLQGQVDLDEVTEGLLDQIVGSLYATSEETFPTLMRIGYATRFRS
jgi:hypothetical protein